MSKSKWWRGRLPPISGFGSTGGSVNLVTKAPNLTPSYEFDSGYGTNQYYRETLDINQPLTDVLPGASFRLNGIYQFNNFSERDYIYNSRWGAYPEFSLVWARIPGPPSVTFFCRSRTCRRSVFRSSMPRG